MARLLALENVITSRVLRQSDTVSSIVGEDAYGALSESELSAVQIVCVRGGDDHGALPKRFAYVLNVVLNECGRAVLVKLHYRVSNEVEELLVD